MLTNRLMKGCVLLDSKPSNFVCVPGDSSDRLWRQVFQMFDLSAVEGRILAYHGSDGKLRIRVRFWRGSLTNGYHF